MYVTPETFRVHMKQLAKNWHVVTLKSLVSAVESGATIPKRTVAVTFDDGWIDNYTEALPILKETGIPGSIFVATGYIGTGDLFWTDKIQIATSQLTKSSQLTQARTAILDQLSNDPLLGGIAQLLFDNTGISISDRIELAITKIKGLQLAGRVKVVDTIWRAAKEFIDIRIPRQFMNWEEVRALAAAGIEVGSHTHKHFNSTLLSAEQFRDEVLNSYTELRRNQLTPLDIFCFPGGYHTAANLAVLKKEGIKHALLAGKVSDFTGDTALFGRIHIHNDTVRSAAEFEAKMLMTPPF
jgi:peptidoglycan/xylan/chitin deacetylase (PgdA/CDA1 family)